MLDKVYSLLESGDSFQAIEAIESSGDTKDIVNTYSALVGDIYGKRHDVTRMLIIGRAGISYTLAAADRIASDDAEQAEKLKGAAKAMSFNVSANAWPGWEDEGITINRSDSIAGLDLARLNLRLAGELKRDDQIVGNAHWLVGAHHLALKVYDKAIKEFSQSVKLSQAAKAADQEHMARGYVGIAKLAADKSNTDGKTELATAMEALREIGSDDAKFFATQLESVSKLFAK